MSNRPHVLILDDEPNWLDRLESKLALAGIRCFCTRDGREAVQLAKDQVGIQVALVDQILILPREKAGGRANVRQAKQGEDVVRALAATGCGIAVGMFTSWPELEGKKAIRGIEDLDERDAAKARTEDESEGYLLGLPNVKRVFHKHRCRHAPASFFREVEEFVRLQASIVDAARGKKRATALVYAVRLEQNMYEALLGKLAESHAKTMEVQEEFERKHSRSVSVNPDQWRSLGISSAAGFFNIVAHAHSADLYYRRTGDPNLCSCGKLGPGVSQVLHNLVGKLAIGVSPIMSADEYTPTRRPPSGAGAVPDATEEGRAFAFGDAEHEDAHHSSRRGTRIAKQETSIFRRIVDSVRATLVGWGFEGTDPKGGPLPAEGGDKETYRAEFDVVVILHHGSLPGQSPRRRSR